MTVLKRSEKADPFGIGLFLEAQRKLDFPTQQRAAYGKTGAYCGEQDQVALFQLALFDGCLHGQGDGAGRSVAVFFNVDDDALRVHAKTIGSGSRSEEHTS